jgi:hypothetical protein
MVQSFVSVGYFVDLRFCLLCGIPVCMKSRFTLEQLDTLDAMIDSWRDRWEHHFKTSIPYDDLKVFVRLERALALKESKMNEDMEKVERPEEVQLWLKNWRESHKPDESYKNVSDKEIHEIYMNNFKIIMGRFNEVTDLNQKITRQQTSIDYLDVQLSKIDKKIKSFEIACFVIAFSACSFYLAFWKFF